MAGIAGAGAGEPDMARLEDRQLRQRGFNRVSSWSTSLAVTGSRQRSIGCAMDEPRPLRRGWTTGACATAAAKAAYAALLSGKFPDPVEIALPGGQRVAFALATSRPEVTARRPPAWSRMPATIPT